MIPALNWLRLAPSTLPMRGADTSGLSGLSGHTPSGRAKRENPKHPDQADLQPVGFTGVCNFILNMHRGILPKPSFKNTF